MSDYVLEARNINKTFPGVKALQNVSINIRKGEVLGLIGENGAGKSTLLKILNGCYPYGTFQGSIFMNGEPQKFHSPYDVHLKGIGFVPQEIDVMDDLSIAENIFVGNLTKNGFVNFTRLFQKTEEFLKGLQIDLIPKAKVRTLSIGQKQLLMIARALSRNPKVLVLDEPTTALTKSEVVNLFNLVCRLKSNETSIIFVTHKLEEILGFTDRVTVLRDGNYISTYLKEEYDEKKIVTDMVGRKITMMYPNRDVQIGEEVFQVKNLTVEHPKIIGRNLISDISFTLKKGEVLGLAGLVGSGRTELLGSLFGRYKCKSGEIYIQGQKCIIRNEKDAIKKGFSIVTEDRKYDGLLLCSTIRKNISISNLKKICLSFFVKERLEKANVKSIAIDLNIKSPSIENMVLSLSGGNQQKVILGRALNNNPQILLLDEPTKGIDVGAKNEVYNIINKLTMMGISIIMVSSELPELIGMSDRILVMSKGSIVGELGKKDGISQEKVMALALSSTNI
jgi:ABC-type sugar transport system ATPase subunit